MIIAVLIMVMIAFVVGVNLLPGIVTAIQAVKTTPDLPAGVGNMLDVLVYVFIALLLMSGVSWIGGQAG